MFKLVAAAPEDGWAFVERDKQLVIIRPPYLKSTLASVPEGAVERAIKHHGFIEQEQSFADWESLISHLREQYLAIRREQGSKVPSLEEIRSLLHLAPDYLLAQFLDRVELELLPQKEYEPAIKLLTYLLGVDAVKKDSDLYHRTVQFLRKAQEAMRNDAERKLKFIRDEAEVWHRFPQALGTYGVEAVRDLAASVSRNGHIFAFS